MSHHDHLRKPNQVSVRETRVSPTTTRERWADGGQHQPRDGIMLCPWHHTRAHDTSYHMTRQPTGKIAFHRRT